MWAKAYTSPSDTTKAYIDLTGAIVDAEQAADDAAHSGNWFARVHFPGNGGTFYILSLSGYTTRTLCETAIETALSPI